MSAPFIPLTTQVFSPAGAKIDLLAALLQILAYNHLKGRLKTFCLSLPQ